MAGSLALLVFVRKRGSGDRVACVLTACGMAASGAALLRSRWICFRCIAERLFGARSASVQHADTLPAGQPHALREWPSSSFAAKAPRKCAAVGAGWRGSAGAGSSAGPASSQGRHRRPTLRVRAPTRGAGASRAASGSHRGRGRRSASPCKRGDRLLRGPGRGGLRLATPPSIVLSRVRLRGPLAPGRGSAQFRGRDQAASQTGCRPAPPAFGWSPKQRHARDSSRLLNAGSAGDPLCSCSRFWAAASVGRASLGWRNWCATVCPTNAAVIPVP
mmetsp:Transcript_18907/g.72083  ORF Transcript_18907/g.72083 Transcript_18907/m.72083 type:complete len:275 (-) Transcript_18907:98-922(-)